MARLPRAVFPGHPLHVTQRGNGRAPTFFCDEDHALYRDRLGEPASAAGIEIWAWVLMPNHVHLILMPGDPDGLRRALSAVHRRYAGGASTSSAPTQDERLGEQWCLSNGCMHCGAFVGEYEDFDDWADERKAETFPLKLEAAWRRATLDGYEKRERSRARKRRRARSLQA